ERCGVDRCIQPTAARAAVAVRHHCGIAAHLDLYLPAHALAGSLLVAHRIALLARARFSHRLPVARRWKSGLTTARIRAYARTRRTTGHPPPIAPFEVLDRGGFAD